MNDAYWDFRAAYNVMVVPNQHPELQEFLKAGMAAAIRYIDQNESDAEKFRANARKARAVLREKIYDTDRFQAAGAAAPVRQFPPGHRLPVDARGIRAQAGAHPCLHACA